MIIDAWLEEKEQDTQQPQCHTDEYGNKRWRVNGLLHREDGPAIEYTNGNKSWYKNGKPYRKDGPVVECGSGDKSWYKNDKLHRVDGPAIEWVNGDKSWYENDKLHRVDGPAIIRGDHKEWWLNGKQVSEEDITQNTEQLPCRIDEEDPGITKDCTCAIKVIRDKTFHNQTIDTTHSVCSKCHFENCQFVGNGAVLDCYLQNSCWNGCVQYVENEPLFSPESLQRQLHAIMMGHQ